MSTIIVVDAWKHCEQEDILRFPFLEDECKKFGAYLNSCLARLRGKHTIVHCADGREIMDEINTSRDIVINKITDINTPGPYYFCGFHLGRCIDRKLKELNAINSNIIHNLSLIFPGDDYTKIDKNLNYCYYTNKGDFTSMNVKKSWNGEPLVQVDIAGTSSFFDEDIKTIRKISKRKSKDWEYADLENNPIYYTKNSLGYRTPEFDFNDQYIIAFGCSNTYGSWIYEENRYTNLVEKQTGIRTYNAGVTGGSANMVMLNIATLLASGVRKPDAIIIQWPKIARLNLPFNIPEPGVKRIRIGENTKTEKIFLDLVANNINPLHTHSEWSKKYVDYLLDYHGIKNIQFSVDIAEAQFYGIKHLLRIDTAADDKHCGTQTNAKIARYLMENL